MRWRPARPNAMWVASPWADVVLAAALTLLGQVELRSAEQAGIGGLAQALALLAQTAAVAIRRTNTVVAVVVGSLGLLVEAVALQPTNTLAGLVAGLVLVYSAARHLDGRALWACSALVLGAVVAHGALRPAPGTVDLAFALLFSGAAWAVGRNGRRREEAAEVANRLAALTQAQHDAQLASAVADERARIAREMHDVVAHGMSVMVVQAAAAEHLIDADPTQARAPLATVRQTGQESLAEMRRLLGLLRTGADAGPEERGAQPTLAQVPALVATLSAAGMPVTLSSTEPESGPVALPPGLDLCAFRIVQESLTNSLKHGHGAPTTVEVTTSATGVELAITTRGPGGERPAAGTGEEIDRSSGHGLIGMRERVAVYGGTLDAGPQPDGGFQVHAQLPVPS